MPKRGNADQDDLFVSQKRLPLKTAGALLALDAWEGSLRVLQAGAGQKTSLSERQKDFTAAEVERLELSAVYATDESWEKLGPFEAAGLKVTMLPRPLAVYWTFREQAGDEPCLVISTGGERTRCSLVVGGELLAESADGSDLSLGGIWNGHLALPSNEPAKMVYEDRRLRDETFEGRAFEGFLSALRTGGVVNVGRFPISPPIHFDGSLRAFRALAARAVAASPVPGLQVRKVILSDWAAAHCNLHELLSADYTVLRGAPRDAFQQAVRGLVSYAVAQAAGPRVEQPQPAEPQPPKRPHAAHPTFAPTPAGPSAANPSPRAADAAETGAPISNLAKPQVVAASADGVARTPRERPVEATSAHAADWKATAGGTPAGSTPTPPAPIGVKPSPEPAPASMRMLLVIAAILLFAIILLWAMISNSARSSGNGTPTPEPTPEPTVRGLSDPVADTNAGMVLIEGGEFVMGRSDSTDPFERPPHRVLVRPFLIDAFEVTREQYAHFLKDDPRAPPPGWERRQFPAGTGKRPVTGVTWDDARAYAKWAGKRLPSEDEWEFAARGSEGRIYPWGNEWRDGAANIGRERGGGPADVGSFAGATPGGVYDLIGNVWEWTESEMRPYPGGRLPPLPPGDLKVIRGGAWRDDTNITGTYRAYLQARGGRDYSGTGFRCARDAPPGAGGQ